MAFPRWLLQPGCRQINNQLCTSLSPGISRHWLLLLPFDSPPSFSHNNMDVTPGGSILNGVAWNLTLLTGEADGVLIRVTEEYCARLHRTGGGGKEII